MVSPERRDQVWFTQVNLRSSVMMKTKPRQKPFNRDTHKKAIVAQAFTKHTQRQTNALNCCHFRQIKSKSAFAQRDGVDNRMCSPIVVPFSALCPVTATHTHRQVFANNKNNNFRLSQKSRLENPSPRGYTHGWK